MFNLVRLGLSRTPMPVAMAYRPNDWLMVRGSWSQEVRAQNLLQLHQPNFERSNARRDYAACAAQLAIKAKAIPALTTNNDYSTSEGRIESRSSNSRERPRGWTSASTTACAARLWATGA